MAEKPAMQKTSYPLPVYNFKVTVDGQSVSFSEASGIAVEYETITYRHGLSCWEGEAITRFRSPKFTPVSLRKGTAAGAGAGFLYRWLTAASQATRPMDISLCDEKGEPVVVWRIARAVPVRLAAPSFDAGSNQVSIETLDLMVSGVSIEHR